MFIYRRSTSRRSFPFGFLCKNVGLAYLLKGNVVMMPYFCSRDSSTRMSSLRLLGLGRLWPKAGLLFTGVSCTLNSPLIPISIRYRTKMSWNSTRRASTACLAPISKMESVQSKLDRNWFRESMSSSGFNGSNFPRSRKSLKICVWMDVCFLSLPGFCGAGNQ